MSISAIAHEPSGPAGHLPSFAGEEVKTPKPRGDLRQQRVIQAEWLWCISRARTKEGVMRLGIATVAVALLIGASVQAEERQVPARESRLLLSVPYLEDVAPVYWNFGWNASSSVETSFAGVAQSDALAPRAEVYFEQSAPYTYWSTGSSLDQAWIRDTFPDFKDQAVRVTTPAPAVGAFMRAARFDAGGARCMAFELRHAAHDTGPTNDDQRQSVSGVYCPPAGVALDDALIQRVFEGIFVRRDGRIERVLRGVNKPIPPQLGRG
jgi:hypothetical protein